MNVAPRLLYILFKCLHVHAETYNSPYDDISGTSSCVHSGANALCWMWRAGVRPLLSIGCGEGVARRLPPLQPVSVWAADSALPLLERREHLLPAGLLQVSTLKPFTCISSSFGFWRLVFMAWKAFWRRSVCALLPANPTHRFGYEVWRDDLPSSLLLLPGTFKKKLLVVIIL